MKIVTVGASGYLGTELMHQASANGHESIGTSRSDSSGLERFVLEDESTWNGILSQNPELVIWSAMPSDVNHTTYKFSNFLTKLDKVKIIYVSSDIVFCKRSLASTTLLGDYARQKRDEQEIVQTFSNSSVFVTGPIYGTNSDGTTDGRTKRLASQHDEQSYWSDVYKTFVPVVGLARTILDNLGVADQHFVGPPDRQSYFDFYLARAQELRLQADKIKPIKINDTELEELGICRDTSYANDISRLWSELPE